MRECFQLAQKANGIYVKKTQNKSIFFICLLLMFFLHKSMSLTFIKHIRLANMKLHHHVSYLILPIITILWDSITLYIMLGKIYKSQNNIEKNIKNMMRKIMKLPKRSLLGSYHSLSIIVYRCDLCLLYLLARIKKNIKNSEATKFQWE